MVVKVCAANAKITVTNFFLKFESLNRFKSQIKSNYNKRGQMKSISEKTPPLEECGLNFS